MDKESEVVFMSYGYIEHVSDQVEQYGQEAIHAAKKIEKTFDVSMEDALKAVEIGTRAMLADAVHHIGNVGFADFLTKLEQMSESIFEISNSLDRIDKE